MKTKRKEYDKFCSAIFDIREQVFKSLKELIHSLGNHIVVPSNIDDYVYNAIAYNGGNHPEYATDCYARFDTIWYDANDDSIFVNYSFPSHFSHSSKSMNIVPDVHCFVNLFQNWTSFLSSLYLQM